MNKETMTLTFEFDMSDSTDKELGQIVLNASKTADMVRKWESVLLRFSRHDSWTEDERHMLRNLMDEWGQLRKENQ